MHMLYAMNVYFSWNSLRYLSIIKLIFIIDLVIQLNCQTVGVKVQALAGIVMTTGRI